VALSIPTLVSSKGIDRVLDVPLDDGEIAKLKNSAATLRATLKTLGF
jgi:malate/lactate dehydrogenase